MRQHFDHSAKLLTQRGIVAKTGPSVRKMEWNRIMYFKFSFNQQDLKYWCYFFNLIVEWNIFADTDFNISHWKNYYPHPYLWKSYCGSSIVVSRVGNDFQKDKVPLLFQKFFWFMETSTKKLWLSRIKPLKMVQNWVIRLNFWVNVSIWHGHRGKVVWKCDTSFSPLNLQGWNFSANFTIF